MEYLKASQDVIDLVASIAAQHHRRLEGCKIAVLMKEKATESKGKLQLAEASIPPAKMSPILDDKYDFVIVIAQDRWGTMSEEQREAVVDHELCHCIYEGCAAIRGHDFEEFAEVVHRHGMWRADRGEQMIQQALLKQGIKVGTRS